MSCSSSVGCKPPVAGACPSWCGTEGLCCKQNEAINECDGTHVRPHISFKETYPLWDDLQIIPNTDGKIVFSSKIVFLSTVTIPFSK